jgi:hypothetical protein
MIIIIKLIILGSRDVHASKRDVVVPDLLPRPPRQPAHMQVHGAGAIYMY